MNSRNPFIRYCNQIATLSEEAETAFSAKLTCKTYVKNELIVTEGDHCRRIYFIESGLVKLCHLTENGSIILRFFAENSAFTILDSFLPQVPSDKYIEALEKSLIWSISYQDLEILSQKYHCFEHFYRIIISMASVNMMKRLQDMMAKSAKQRYDIFLNENNKYINRISLGDVAAYIGITQVSLSRIRKLS